jgi:hypothetical protein
VEEDAAAARVAEEAAPRIDAAAVKAADALVEVAEGVKLAADHRAVTVAVRAGPAAGAIRDAAPPTLTATAHERTSRFCCSVDST